MKATSSDVAFINLTSQTMKSDRFSQLASLRLLEDRSDIFTLCLAELGGALTVGGVQLCLSKLLNGSASLSEFIYPDCHLRVLGKVIKFGLSRSTSAGELQFASRNLAVPACWLWSCGELQPRVIMLTIRLRGRRGEAVCVKPRSEDTSNSAHDLNRSTSVFQCLAYLVVDVGKWTEIL